MTPYPLIYCPPGVGKPACCPHAASLGVAPGKGPDSTVGGAEEMDRPGIVYGGPLRADDGTRWVKTPAGWWLGLNEHRPENLQRLRPHPAVTWWTAIAGADPDQHWRIPAILARQQEGDAVWWVSALDRRWDGQGWSDPAALAFVQEPLLALATGQFLREDVEARNAAVRALAVDLLSVGHWVDSDLLAATGWLSETLVARIIRAALGREGAPT